MSSRDGMFSFLRDASLLSIATAFGYGIAFLSLPILARVYNPGAFGALATFIALGGFVAFFATFRTEEIIVLPKDEHKAEAFTRALTLASIAVGLVVLLVILLLVAFGVEKTFGVDRSVVILLGPGVAFLALTVVLRLGAVRKRLFSTIALAVVLRAAVAFALALAYGLWVETDAPLGLCLGQVGGDLTACVILGFAQRGLFVWRWPGWLANAREVARTHGAMLATIAFSQLIANAYAPIAVLALGIGANASAVGWYGMAVRVIVLPSTLLASSISDVFRQRASESKRSGQGIAQLVLRVRLIAAGIAALPYLVLAVGAPTLFAIFLGGQWREAGVYAAILSISGLLSFVAGVTDRTAMILDRSRYLMIYHSLRFAAEAVPAAGLVLHLLTPLQFVIGVAVLRSLVYCLDLLFLHVAAHRADRVALETAAHEV